VGALLLVVLALVVGAVAFLLNPPSSLLRRAALPLARQLLHHPRLHIGAVTLLPGSRLELRDVLLGAPRGYSRPLLRLGSVLVRYDLSTLTDGEITVRQIQLERPVVHLETRQGKANWQAFLAGFTGDKPAQEPEPEEPGGLPDIKVRLDSVSIIGLAAALDDGHRRVVLDSLNLALGGFYSPTASDLRLRLTLEPRQAGSPSLTLGHGEAKQRMEADLDTRLDLAIRLQDLHRPKVELELALDLASKRLVGPVPLSPVKASLRLEAVASLAEDRLRIRRLGLTLADEEIIALEGTVRKLTEGRELDLLLSRLRLPLDKLAPYAAAFLPGVEVGGLVEVRDLRLRSSQAELQALANPTGEATTSLPRLEGTVRARKVRVRLARDSPAGVPLRLDGLDLDLALSAGGAAPLDQAQILAALPPAATSPAPGSLKAAGVPVALLARLGVGAFKGMGARVRGMDLSLSAGAGLDGGLRPGPAALRVALSAPTISYRSAATGALSLGLRAEAAGSAHLVQRNASLKFLELEVPKLLKARLQASLEQWGQRALNADLRLWPVDLKRVVAWLPPRLKAPLGKARLSGTVELKARARGRLPGAGPIRPLSLPLDLNLDLGLRRVALDDPGRELKLAGLEADLDLRTRSNLIHLDGQLSLASLAKPDLTMDLSGLKLTPLIKITREKVHADLALALDTLRKADLGLVARSLKLKQRLSSRLRVDRLLAGRSAWLGSTASRTTLSLGGARLSMPANTLSADRSTFIAKADLEPSRGNAAFGLAGTLARFSHEEQGLLVKDLKLNLTDHMSGHKGIQLPRPRIHLAGITSVHSGTLSVGTLNHKRSGAKLAGAAFSMDGKVTGFTLRQKGGVTLEHLTHRAGLKLDTLALKGVVTRPLRKSALDLDLTMHKLKDVRLKKLSLRLPGRGVYLDMSGAADSLFPLDTTRLPRFKVKAEAGVDNPKQTEEPAATFLVPGVRGAGKVGLALQLTSSDGQRLGLSGKVLADDFYLWQRGGSAGRSSRIELRDLDANIPFSQQVTLKGGRLRLPRPRKQLTAMRGKGNLYPELRPFSRAATGMSLGGALYEREGLKGKQKLRLDRAELDLSLEDNAIRMRRLYLKLFGGDIAGSLQAQVISLAPLDLVLQLRTQVTGVNLAYLDREATEYTEETEVSAMLDLGYRPAREELAGRVEITSLSLKMLDAMLAYLDPDRTNPSVQENRKLLAAWYMRWIDPRVRLVSLWIRHGNLNMDIKMDAWFVVGTILRKVLEDMRIRRVNILPVLRREVTPMLRKAERALGGISGKAKTPGAAGAKTKQKRRAKP